MKSAIRHSLAVLATLALTAVGACAAGAPSASEDSLRARRLALVREIEASGVRDSATLAAMRGVPRHEFVPARWRDDAYVDYPLPIGEDQTISQPSLVAIMTEAIRPRTGLKVLEIGTGSGYQAAVLAAIGCRVYTIELLKPLADSARARLARLGYGGVQVRHGDGYLGWPEAAPFDAILITAAPPEVPDTLVAQLARGGRLLAPVGEQDEIQLLTLVQKDSAGRVTRTEMLPVRFVPMRRGKRRRGNRVLGARRRFRHRYRSTATFASARSAPCLTRTRYTPGASDAPRASVISCVPGSGAATR